MKLYTIGFTKKTAKRFFTLLKDNNVKRVIDVRLGTTSQLAGFAKGEDLEYFCSIHGIAYVHFEELAPTKELRVKYSDKKVKMTFEEYTKEFEEILEKRDVIKMISNYVMSGDCFLCSEENSLECHRSIVLRKIKEFLRIFKAYLGQSTDVEVEIINL